MGCDLHSHLIPGIDDGAPTPEAGLSLVKGLQDLGFKKIITTPHVHGDFYPNTKEQILKSYEEQKLFLKSHEVSVDFEIGAEYYLDNYFLKEVLPHGLLSFGDRYVLMEVSLAGWPKNIDELIFSTQSKGYKIIMAHPERYLYEPRIEVFEKWKEKGVFFQLNLPSISGYYNKHVRQRSEDLLAAGLYDFLATDMHHERHLKNLNMLLHNGQSLLVRLKDYGHFKNLGLL